MNEMGYVIGDVNAKLEVMETASVDIVAFDDAWARPQRNGALGVEYPTHDFERTKSIIDEIYRVLKPGGWLLADADDWLQPRLVTYIRNEWGDVAATYSGGGYRRSGGVTYLTADGQPHRGMGEYTTNAGYHVVFAHKNETDRRSSVAARQLAQKPTKRYGWGSIKPIDPYYKWLDGLSNPSDHVVVPCAGTAPAAIAATQLDLNWTAIDSEVGARDAFRKRLADATKIKQSTIS